jgi:hypothetical protein
MKGLLRRSDMKLVNLTKLGTKAILLVSLVGITSCGRELTSQEDVVDIAGTPSKWQSIGNCWAYSAVGWIESLALRNASLTLDVSETYITYRDWQEKLRRSNELQTGGSVPLAMRLLQKYGYVLEKDMIPAEAGRTFSETQKRAETYIKESLATGLLSKQRDQATIIAELDKAFGVKIDQIALKALSLDKLMIGKDDKGNLRSANAEYQDWTSVGWYNEENPTEIPGVNKKLSSRQSEIIRLVKAALNAGHPVVMDWFVDFGALDSNGIFSLETLKANPESRQGYHSTVLEDYVVGVKDPVTGVERIIGEGEVSDSEKALALEKGTIKYLVVKNSWGGLERRDRASYVRGTEGGFHRLDANYLFSTLRDRENEFDTTVISNFILPKSIVRSLARK